jgi:hypothetical protein
MLMRIPPLNMSLHSGRSRRLAVLLAIAAAVAAPAASADGDPASDYLLSQQTFVSPNARISSSDQSQLNALLTAARRGGYTIRVAVIQSRYDLGAVTALDKKPRLYSHFLSQELRLVYKKRLLVVMPNGYGIANDGKPAPAEQAVLGRLAPAGTLDGSALVAAALAAVQALTTHAGIRIADLPTVATRSSGDTATRDHIVIGSAAALLLLLTGGLTYVRRRGA